jgi:hypothetical protein
LRFVDVSLAVRGDVDFDVDGIVTVSNKQTSVRQDWTVARMVGLISIAVHPWRCRRKIRLE